VLKTTWTFPASRAVQAGVKYQSRTARQGFVPDGADRFRALQHGNRFDVE
jgi:hypothetical protein